MNNMNFWKTFIIFSAISINSANADAVSDSKYLEKFGINTQGIEDARNLEKIANNIKHLELLGYDIRDLVEKKILYIYHQGLEELKLAPEGRITRDKLEKQVAFYIDSAPKEEVTKKNRKKFSDRLKSLRNYIKERVKKTFKSTPSK